MKSRLPVLFLIFFSLTAHVFASGAQEQQSVQAQSDEWILCITDIDVRSLPAEKAGISGVISRIMVEKLSEINYRTRVSPEYAYYEQYAWTNARNNAARALAAKVQERSQQIYRGDAGWRYQRNIARLDAEIEQLRRNLEEIENNAPLINNEPVFNLIRGNLEFTFPAAPAAGNEYRFLRDRSADAFLAVSISDFYGRYFLTLKLYTVYTRSFVWEDSILFSHDELDNALEEILRRLVVVISGNEPAAVVVNAQPEEALLLINSTFAGRGATDVLGYPPGTITVSASAPNHESITFETTLSAGELSEISINLNPIEYSEVTLFSDAQGSVYHGAFYAGEAPLTLRLPVNQLEYIELETYDGYRATAIFQTPENQSYSSSLLLHPQAPYESGRVEEARSSFYWAFGGTWIAGIAAWISYYTFVGANNALSYGYYNHDIINEKFVRDNQTIYYVSMGTLIATGALAVYGIYRLVEYISISSRGGTPVMQTSRN